MFGPKRSFSQFADQIRVELSSAEAARRDAEWDKTRKRMGERSPRISVSYNRRSPKGIGSISPDLLAKLAPPPEPMPTLQMAKKSSGAFDSNRNISSMLLNKDEFPEPEPVIPDPKVEIQTIRNILCSEPIEERFDSLEKHNIEFQSYLRPVLKENVFKSGGSWDFLQNNVFKNDELFKKILKERHEIDAFRKQREDHIARMEN